MQDDLKFVASIQGNGTSELNRDIFGAVDGPTYSDFFTSRVLSVGLWDCGGGGAVACVAPYRDSSKMFVSNYYVKFDHPQIARVMVVFHESRHTENGNQNWMHARCPTPFNGKDGKPLVSIFTGLALAGKPGCDVTPFGSYGSSTIMLKNIEKFCTNCSSKTKMDAGIYGDDQMNRIIDADAHKEMEHDLYGAK